MLSRNKILRFKRIFKLPASFVVVCLSVQGCGSGIDCNPLLGSLDPSGHWKGTLVRIESDCEAKSRGQQFDFEHDVSLECKRLIDSEVSLYNEDNLEFKESSRSVIGGGSFTVKNAQSNLTIEISYDNYDGSLADVTEKIRVYSNDKLVCSEKYKGQAKR